MTEVLEMFTEWALENPRMTVAQAIKKHHEQEEAKKGKLFWLGSDTVNHEDSTGGSLSLDAESYQLALVAHAGKVYLCDISTVVPDAAADPWQHKADYIQIDTEALCNKLSLAEAAAQEQREATASK